MGTPSDGASEAAQQNRTDTGNDRIIQKAGAKAVPFTARARCRRAALLARDLER